METGLLGPSHRQVSRAQNGTTEQSCAALRDAARRGAVARSRAERGAARQFCSLLSAQRSPQSESRSRASWPGPGPCEWELGTLWSSRSRVSTRHAAAAAAAAAALRLSARGACAVCRGAWVVCRGACAVCRGGEVSPSTMAVMSTRAARRLLCEGEGLPGQFHSLHLHPL